MKRKSLIIIILILQTLIINCQVIQEWVRKYDYFGPNGMELATSIAVDNSENVYVTGFSHSNSIADYATVKYSSKGEQLWSSRFNANSSGAQCRVFLDQKDNVLVMCGSIGVSGHNEYTLIKYNKLNGYVIWIRKFYNPQLQDNYPFAMTIDRNNNIYLTGDGGTVKFSSSGEQIWFTATGFMKSIVVDKYLNVYMTGGEEYSRTVRLNNIGALMWEVNYSGMSNFLVLDDSSNVYVAVYNWITGYSILKLTSLGIYKWVRNYPMPVAGSEYVPQILLDKTGNIILCGMYTNSSNSTDDYLVVKYSSNGTFLWDKKYNGPGNDHDWARALKLDEYDNIYVTGVSIGNSSQPEMATLKFDPAGNLKWLKRYVSGGPSQSIDLAIRNSNVFITGNGSDAFSNGDQYVTIKYSQVIGIEPISSQIPKQFKLHQNYPNPFNPTTKIRFDIPPLQRSSEVRLVLYDIRGREVATLVNEQLSLGTYEVEFDGSSFASGVYFYSLIADGFKETRSLVLIK